MTAETSFSGWKGRFLCLTVQAQEKGQLLFMAQECAKLRIP